MSAEAQRIVVIQDASREVSPTAIRWIIQGFSLKPGDVLILLGVLHQVNSPMGYKVKMDSSSMFGVNPKLIADEVSKKKEEYSSNVEIMNISKLCETQQIEFSIEVRAGDSPKTVALNAAKSFKASWVILDRKMKKDKKYFMEKLPCSISRMKRDNTIELLQAPKQKEIEKNLTETETKSRDHRNVRYDEMLPGSKDGIFPHKPLTPPKTSKYTKKDFDHGKEILATASASSVSNLDPSTSSFAKDIFSLNVQVYEIGTNRERETGDLRTSADKHQQQIQKKAYNTRSPDEEQKEHDNNDCMQEGLPDEVFENSLCSVCKNRRPKIGWKRDFSYAELHAATNGFSPKNFLSEGGFCSVYKGEFNGMKIAVKQHKLISFQGEREFKSEVSVLSRARHENLVMLLGSCSEGSRRLLVYEYVCNGSLDQHISQHTRRTLSWDKRLRIATGAAKGLKYLHDNNIIHRDMRPNNILITHDYNSLLGDFGLAKTHDAEDQTLETRVVGTLGYMAPEYAECGKVSTKTDVYSFGVVLLQLITGLKTNDKTLGGKSLVRWARPLLKERNYPDLIDPKILDSHDIHQLFWMVQVAEKCLSKDPQKRLIMDKVVYALDYITVNNKASSTSDLSSADSASSAQDSTESPEDDIGITEEFVPINSINTMNARLQPLPPMPTVSLRGSSPSATYEHATSSQGSTQNKRIHTITVKGKLLYDDMID